MAEYDPFGIYGGSTTARPVAKGTAAANYTGGTAKSNVGRIYDPFGINEQTVHTPIPSTTPSNTNYYTPKAQPSTQQQATSLFGKIGNFANENLVQPAVTTGAKTLNTLTAGGAGLIGAGTAGVQVATGDKKGAKNTVAATNQTIADFLSHGVGDRGGYLTPEQASSRGGGAKSLVNNFVKPTAQAVTDIAPYAIPVGKVAKGASLLTKVGTGAIENAAIAGGSTVANEALNGQLTTDNGNQILKNTAFGAALGALVPGIHGGIKAGANEASRTIDLSATKALVKNQRVRNILDTVQKQQEATPPEIKPQIDQGKVDAGLIKPEISTTPRSELAVGANDMHKVDSQKVGQYVKQIKDGEPIEPVITHTVNGQKFVVDGQQKLAAAEKLGIEKIPTVEKTPSIIPQGEKVSEMGGDRSNNSLQSAIEKAHNAGDNATVVKLITQLPKEDQISMKSALGISKSDMAIKYNPKSYDEAGNLTPEAAKQITAINKGTRTPASEKPISYKPIEEKPLITPEIKTSKLAQGVETKAIQKGLTQGFGGLPEYAKVNVADQAKSASDLLKADPERATRIALGHERPPEGLLPESAFVAVEKQAHKTGNVDLLRRLATESTLSSEATGMGQRIRLLGERNPNSAVTGIRKVVEARKTAAEAKLVKKGTTVNKEISATVRQIRQSTPMKITRQDWHAFIEGIKCQ